MKLQFRLRTLMIVVTLLAVPIGYVGWQAKIVRERKAMAEIHALPDGGTFPTGTTVVLNGDIPWLRRLLGDPDFIEISGTVPLETHKSPALLPPVDRALS